MTTFRPAVDGSGEEAIVNAPDVHGVVQHAVVQQFVVEQHGLDCAQQVPVEGQHGVEAAARSGEFVGVGQHGMISPRARCCGQTI